MSVLPYFRVLLVSFAIGAALSAQVKVDLDKLVKVKEWGYQIQPIKDWKSMPADQEDRFNVGRWKLSVDQFEKSGDWENMQTGRFVSCRSCASSPRTTLAGAPGAEEKPDKKERPVGLPAQFEKKLNPKTMDD
jgi:hypothetical protein